MTSPARSSSPTSPPWPKFSRRSALSSPTRTADSAVISSPVSFSPTHCPQTPRKHPHPAIRARWRAKSSVARRRSPPCGRRHSPPVRDWRRGRTGRQRLCRLFGRHQHERLLNRGWSPSKSNSVSRPSGLLKRKSPPRLCHLDRGRLGRPRARLTESWPACLESPRPRKSAVCPGLRSGPKTGSCFAPACRDVILQYTATDNTPRSHR